MDISKPSIQLTQANSNNTPSISQSSIISEVQDLRLETGKIYTATVIRAKDTATIDENNVNTSTESIPNKDASSQLKNLQTKTTIHINEWIISVNGKSALISSEKPLEIGQKLLLQLSTSNHGTPTLAAKLLTNQIPITSALTAQSTQLQTPSQLSPSLILNTLQHEHGMKLITSAIGLTLDKQLPLELGINQFTSLLNQALKSGNSNQLIKEIQTAQQTLTSSMMKQEQIKEFVHLTPEKIQGLLKQQLNNSGLFMEHNLSSSRENLIQFKQQLEQIQISAKSLNNTTKTEISKPEALSDFVKTYAPAIEKIQRTIEQLLKANTPPPSNHSIKTPSINQDIKATLIGLISSLRTQLTPHISEHEFNTLLAEGFSELSLPSPFAFPNLGRVQHGSKTLFEKTDNAVGQILKLLAGMLNKIQFNQLHSLLQSATSTDGPSQQTWFFELPVVNNNQSVTCFNFRLDKEEQKTSTQAKEEKETTIQWKLLLSFDLDHLGPIYVLVRLAGQTISSELWADKDATLKLLQSETQHFKQQLEKVGLEVGEICCKKGHPSDSKTKLSRHLVDIKA